MFNFTAFFSYAVVASISPGPNAIVSMANASKYSLKKSLLFNVGVGVGVFFVMLLCGVFSATILNVFPALQSVMIWVGAVYILWLAWKTFRSEPMNDECDEEGGSAESMEKSERMEKMGQSGKMGRSGRLFVHGSFLQFINPNTILYGITVFSTFILPYFNSTLMLVLFSGILSLMALVLTSCWTLFGSIFRNFVVRYGKFVNIVLALLLVYCAVSLVL